MYNEVGHPAYAALQGEMVTCYDAKAFIEESLSPEWIGSTGQGPTDEAAADHDLGDNSC